MTLRTNWYTMDNKLGVDLNYPETRTTVTTTVTGIPELPGSSHNLGDVVLGNNGSKWMYVQAAATVTAQNLISINSANVATVLTSTLATSNTNTIGLAQMAATAAATSQYFWALLEARNGAFINTTGSCLTGTQLYISSGTVGVVTTSVSTVALKNIYTLSSATATTATLEVAMLSEITVST